jgi:3-dehydroquinate synthase/shikimate kinase/3-dehydroquinate synthase
MKIIINHTTGSYPVLISDSGFNKFYHLANKRAKRDAFLIIDSNVYKSHWNYINKNLQKNFTLLGFCKFTATDKKKSLSELKIILNRMFQSDCKRSSLLISIGGGITGDVSAFAASIYMRGINYIHIPTTLLSMVDSSIGGKTGINFNFAKNLIGTFHQPEAVIIDTSFLATLPKREIYSGIGEIIKYGFLSGNNDQAFFDSNFRNVPGKNFKGVEKIIYKCLLIKSSVVQKDEREETGLRKILNFGHTFAHGLESASHFKIKHGEAVILGIISSLFYSYRVNLISGEYLLCKLNLMKDSIRFIKKISGEFRPDEVIKRMYEDKKRTKKDINLVLMSNTGEFIIDYPAKKKLLYSSIDDMQVWIKESV